VTGKLQYKEAKEQYREASLRMQMSKQVLKNVDLKVLCK
jgi:hypothetical protein